ncbi:MAG: hypothetical protein M3Y74_11955, partial [Chloroflexota bacterium]|nr:hypothetical protein [Chloroflexota bacterium]
DTQQETNGLLTADREPKLDPAAISAITRSPTAAMPGDVIRQIQESRGVTPFAGTTMDAADGGV